MSREVHTSKINQFSFKLFEKLSKTKNENFFISPFSITTCLNMVLAGADTETANQLKTALNLNDLSSEQIFEMNHEYLLNLDKNLSDDVALNIANKIFQQDKFNLLDTYTNNLKKHFRSCSQSVNFVESEKSAKIINDWVEEETNKKIKNLISPDILDDLTRLVLINAIYFKAKWSHQFKKENTQKDDFFLKDGKASKVDMMKLTDKKFRFKMNPGGLKARSCELPYAGNSAAMTIILPHEEISIDEVESELNAEVLDKVFEHEPIPLLPVHVYLPSFKLEYKAELSDCLKSLGVTNAFDNNADFSLMSNESRGLCISNVIHQAVVEVNEEGTEAAAATAAVMMKRSMPIPPEEFRCNRPFIFVIHEKETNGILFMGKFMAPVSN